MTLPALALLPLLLRVSHLLVIPSIRAEETHFSQNNIHFSSELAESTSTRGALSQWGEDMFLYENYFFGMKNGIVVESGALDGIYLSNSYFFEKNLEWFSVLIEANPKNYKKLKVSSRSNCKKVHAALCNVEKGVTVHFIIAMGKKTDSAISGIYEFMSEEHKERYFEPVKSFLDNHDLSSQAINDAKLMNSKGSIYKAYEVDCLSMQQIMNEINIGHINLWSLDVEGAELSVLQSHNFHAVPVDVLLIEVEGATCTKTGCVFPNDVRNGRRVEIIAYLESKAMGFDCSQVYKGSLVCVHKSFIPSSRASRGSGHQSTMAKT